MNYSILKPYDAGYRAPPTNAGHRTAVLEMAEEEYPSLTEQDIGAPFHLTLRLALKLHFYEGPATLERMVNGQSGGVTPFYLPGNVLCDGSDHLKPLCKVRAVEFVYQGCGFYWDDHEMNRPFYESHPLGKLIQLKPGQGVFHKPFAGRDADVRLETHFKKQDREEWTEVVRFGRNTYPLYPYGGYVPLHGDLREMEQVYAFPGVDRSEGQLVTALKLYRSSFFHLSGGFPPEPFFHDQKKWVFPQRVTPLEQMTVGQALCDGHLTFTLKDEMGDLYSYASYGYEQPGGSMKYIHVHCARKEKARAAEE